MFFSLALDNKTHLKHVLELLKSAVEFGKPWLYISSASLFHVRLEPMSKFAILDAFSAKLLA